MKTETIKIIGGHLIPNVGKTTVVNFLPWTIKNIFGQTLISGTVGDEDTYIFISKDLILKSTKIKS